ncbi:MAG: thiamine pyrophosphate-dependent enzyme [Bacillota bacterium]|nr:thiamine pyrophosphate-dependent enzyme [Bacillota bacterium]
MAIGKVDAARRRERVEQRRAFLSGNEAAAEAARQIDFHVMGYFPITPSTEIPENIDAMYAEGEHHIRMIPADGEHGAAGICFGAAVGGGRVLNATSAQGLLFSLEELPVQAGLRLPMVLNLVTRTVSGPLDIHGDHSDLYYTLNTGWLILFARDPQAVYDMNLLAVRLGEHPEVRLPVIVAQDGFFTSHQKRPLHLLPDEAARAFVGEPEDRVGALDPRHPVTVGAYMNEPDQIQNKMQLHLAMEAARRVLPGLWEEYARLTGRRYGFVDAYRTEDAEAVVVLLGSAAETAKDAADALREEGFRVGVLTLDALRPFPAEEIARALAGAGVVLIGDRADSYGSGGGNLAHEVRAALQQAGETPLTLSRIYGLGGRDFTRADARHLFLEALEARRRPGSVPVFDYHGVTPGDPALRPEPVLPPLGEEEVSPHLVKVEQDETTGRLKVKVPPLAELNRAPARIVPGHGACPGCGIFPAVNGFLRALDGDVVLLFQTGCGEVVSTPYPRSAYRVTWVHNLFQNGAATLSGLVEMFHERQRRGEIPADRRLTFVMVSGDGGMDIGMGSAIGAALRGHGMIVLEYDNEGYMNTGSQLSYSTPLGHQTSTSGVGPAEFGKGFQHKDTPQIMAATHIPYVFTGCEAFPQDLAAKAAKAQWYADHGGFVYGKLLSSCPLNWRIGDDAGPAVLKAAVDSCFFPLYEVERGKTTLTYDPEAHGRRIPVEEWLKRMGKSRHLLEEPGRATLRAFADEVERRWRRLKAMHESPWL